MKYLSLFSGIGGFELGIQRAYEAFNNQSSAEIEQDRKGRHGDSNIGRALFYDRSAPPLCIGYSEIDKYAIEIYQKHFPNHRPYGDFKKIETATLPDFDLLVGGFPCQPFSVQGKRGGFEDTRGTLFFEIARILNDKKPGYFIFENVKGLLNHDSGNTFAKIITTLLELGYSVEWQVLNSKYFGVAQRRERVFIVGHLRGFSGRQIFPFGEVHEVPGSQNQSEKRRPQTIVSPTLKGANMKADNAFILENSKIRRMTPTEHERLQGFPDGWTEGVSDSQRYKTLGNAVTVNVIHAIIEKLI